MRSKLYFFSFIFLLVGTVACKKWLPENRIIGTWKIVDAERKRAFSNDHFTTGYENGSFAFEDNGNVTYMDAALQMNGNWRMRRTNDGYYDSDGNWQDNGKTVLVMKLYDFGNNRVLDWYFDRIDFRSSGNKLIAFMDGGSYVYKYDFRKQ